MIEELVAEFSPETFSEWCRAKFDRFTTDPHDVSNDEGFPKASVVGYVTSLPDGSVNRPLLVMSVHAGPQIGERSSRRRQFDFARKQLLAAIDKPPAKVKGLFTQGLFVFHDDAGNFRLSLVSGRSEGKKLVFSDFKRQSFFVHSARNNKTFRTRMALPFASYDALNAAFSVETLTKEFYNSLFAWYERAMASASKVSFPNNLTRADDDRAHLPEHLIRLITRLMFIWFIRQKGLIPDKIFDTAALQKMLKAFDPLSRKQDTYYRAILQNLFFATLNCEITKREFAKDGAFTERKQHFDIKILYRYRDDFAVSEQAVLDLFRQVPFLNGGLFECLDKKTDYQDGFSRNEKCVAHVPNALFFDDHGLITLFDRFDFTVDENDPNDSDVALDPELLGKVFENLLGAYNPETRETARKQSGSFYTPREIVNYMVDESLVAHMRTQAPEIEEALVRQFLGSEKAPALAEAPRRQLVESLYHCRILDPACGSGAFPMGLLQKMVHLLQRLDENNTLWHEVVMAEAEKALSEAEALDADEKRQRRQRITESFDQNVNQPDYARKLYLIENCIFGVDIQPIAVQIAKLRTFITLVCDQKPDLDDAASNYRMLPLPNLETKFVAANSLIGLSSDFAEGLTPAEGGSRLDDPELVHLRARLAEIRHRHFRARDSREKNDCRKQDRDLRDKIKSRLVAIACKPNAAKIALYQGQIENLTAKRKSVANEEWQDVIQTRPQQGNFFDSAPVPVQSVIRLDVNKEERDRIDDDISRYIRTIADEKSRAKNKSAFQEEADRLADWDPYDQNASSPFFDPEWMFGFKGGFDIVIGNPPYVRQEAIKEQKPALKAQNFASFNGTADLFVYFYERGVQLLAPHGHICYITSNKYYRAGYGKELRAYLTTQTRMLQLIDFGDAPVFEAIAYPSIFLASRIMPDPTHKVDAFVWSPGPSVATFPALYQQHRFAVPQASLRPDGWQLERSDVLALLDKLRAAGTPLGEYVDGKFYRGVLTGLNEAFVVDRATRDRLIAEHSSSAEILKPFLRGRDVKRWRCEPQDLWLIFTRRGTKIAAYPAIQRHLSKFKKKLMPGVAGGRKAGSYKWFEIQDNTAYWQEFERPKIVYPNICKRNEFTWDCAGYFTNQKAFIIPTADKALLAILNSHVIFYLFQKCVARLQNDFYEPSAIFMKKFPIAIASSKQKALLATLVDRIIAAKAADPDADVTALEAEIDKLVYELYGLTDDEIAIVEGRDATAKPQLVAQPAKPAAGHRPKKSVMTEDPDLA